MASLPKEVQYDMKKTRTFVARFYPEDAEHMRVFEELKNHKHAYIVHNKDCTEDGELKKEHIHMVISFPNGRKRTGLATEYNINKTVFEPVMGTLMGALRYLIHADNPEKYEYDIEEVHGELKTRLKENLIKGDRTEGEAVLELFDWIDSQRGMLRVRDIAGYCASNGYWDVFRRSASVFIKIVEEHNEMVKKRYE